jgi:hypothetical protein
LGAWGTLIHEKNLKSKISCQTPFKANKLITVGKFAKKILPCIMENTPIESISANFLQNQ